MFSIARNTVTRNALYRFRPLSGIMFSINWWSSENHERQCLRPLSGIMFSIDNAVPVLRILCFYVSVPSRGLCFQWTTRKALEEKYGYVSVPSRGLCFQSKQYLWSTLRTMRVVSVPLGDCVFNPNILEGKIEIAKGFRPLSGIVFSIIQGAFQMNLLTWFPSPLGDCVFNHKENGFGIGHENCFRPLSGIVFSIAFSFFILLTI